MLIVHNLVKRYYTKAPASNENNEQDHRPANENGDDVQAEEGKDKKVVPGFNAVKGTSFGVKRGEVFSLLGTNGAGKSSTFDCLAGSSRTSGGTVMIDG